MNRSYHREVLECARPLALWKAWVVESARGLAHSKTLLRFILSPSDAAVQGLKARSFRGILTPALSAAVGLKYDITLQTVEQASVKEKAKAVRSQPATESSGTLPHGSEEPGRRSDQETLVNGSIPTPRSPTTTTRSAGFT